MPLSIDDNPCPSTTIQIPAFLYGFRAIHLAMRRDARRLVRVAPHVNSSRQVRRLERWFDLYSASIEHHHQREDAVVWPLLVERDERFAARRAGLERDHRSLDAAMAQVTAALDHLADGSSDPGLLLSAAAQLRQLLDEHLDREEAAAFPLIARSFTADEYRLLEAQLRDGMSMSALAFEAPWLLDDLPVEQATSILAEVPAVLRLLNTVAFRPRYRRLTAILTEASRGTS